MDIAKVVLACGASGAEYSSEVCPPRLGALDFAG